MPTLHHRPCTHQVHVVDQPAAPLIPFLLLVGTGSQPLLSPVCSVDYMHKYHQASHACQSAEQVGAWHHVDGGCSLEYHALNDPEKSLKQSQPESHKKGMGCHANCKSMRSAEPLTTGVQYLTRPMRRKISLLLLLCSCHRSSHCQPLLLLRRLRPPQRLPLQPPQLLPLLQPRCPGAGCHRFRCHCHCCPASKRPQTFGLIEPASVMDVQHVCWCKSVGYGDNHWSP